MSAQYFAQIDSNNVVTNVAVVQQDFLEANPERYTGIWVETFLIPKAKLMQVLGFIYDPATQDFLHHLHLNFLLRNKCVVHAG
jgi:hypothetical protein